MDQKFFLCPPIGGIKFHMVLIVAGLQPLTRKNIYCQIPCLQGSAVDVRLFLFLYVRISMLNVARSFFMRENMQDLCHLCIYVIGRETPFQSSCPFAFFVTICGSLKFCLLYLQKQNHLRYVEWTLAVLKQLFPLSPWKSQTILY